MYNVNCLRKIAWPVTKTLCRHIVLVFVASFGWELGKDQPNNL